MGLGRGVDAQPRQSVAAGDPARRGVDAGRLARGGERDQRRRRRGVGQEPVERCPAARAPGAASRRPPPRARSPIGDVRQSIAFWPIAAVSISPRIPGPTPSSRSTPGSPGAARRSRSARPGGGSRRGSPSSGSGASGAAAGNSGAIEPARRREDRRSSRSFRGSRPSRRRLRGPPTGTPPGPCRGGRRPGPGRGGVEAGVVARARRPVDGGHAGSVVAAAAAFPAGQVEAPRQRVGRGASVPGKFSGRCVRR